MQSLMRMNCLSFLQNLSVFLVCFKYCNDRIEYIEEDFEKDFQFFLFVSRKLKVQRNGLWKISVIVLSVFLVCFREHRSNDRWVAFAQKKPFSFSCLFRGSLLPGLPVLVLHGLHELSVFLVCFIRQAFDRTVVNDDFQFFLFVSSKDIEVH